MKAFYPFLVSISLVILSMTGILSCKNRVIETVTLTGMVDFDRYKPDKSGAADVSSLLQQAIDDCVDQQCILLLSAGTYRLDKTVNIRGALTIRGAGKATTTERGVTRLITTSLTNTLINVEADGKNVVFEDFSLENTATANPTAGSGLRIVDADGTVLNRMSFINFFNNISVESGIYWKVNQCSVFDPVNYGIWIRNTKVADIGDMSITATDFVTNYMQERSPVAAIQWQSGGGLRFQNNKINWAGGSRWQYGLRLMPDAGVQTSDFLITGNSIENCTVHGLYVGSTNSNYTINSLIMTGNQFGIINDTSVLLDLPNRDDNPDNQGLQSVEITGNQLYGQWGIRARNVSYLNIGSNHYSVSVGMVKVGRCHSVGYVPGNLKPFPNPNGHILYENETADELTTAQGNLQLNFSREIPAANDGALYDITVSSRAGSMITADATGTVNGVGDFATHVVRYVSQNGSDTPNMTVVGNDFTTGNAATLNWLPSNDKVTLQIAGRGGSAQGTLRLSIAGPLKKIVQR